MSFKEAKELRKSGKLTEALEMALQDLQNEPHNIWCKRSVAWVYYDYLKVNKEAENFDAFYGYLLKIKELELPEAELMLFDQCAWQVGLMIFNLCRADEEISKNDNKNKFTFYSSSKELEKKVYSLFEIIKNFQFTKPGDGYSFLFKALNKAFKDTDSYIEVADWWGFENFRKDDYLKEEVNGKFIMSIAEQAYIAYAKRLLMGELPDGDFQQREVNRDKINDFLPKLGNVVIEHPKLLYPEYFKAKLLLALGDEDVLEHFRPFAIRKRNDFWVWDLLSDIFPKDDTRKIACLCKALTCKTQDDFLVKIRQKLAALLIQGKQYVEAKTEIESILATRNSNNWPIRGELLQWQSQDWYKSTESRTDNKNFYQSQVSIAEEILLADKPERTVVVEFVNSHKKILNFVESKTSKGFFFYGDHLKEVSIGNVLKVRFKENPQGEHYKLLSAKLSEEEPDSDVVKDFSDNLKVIPYINIGFAGDVFIDSKTIEKKNLQPNQPINGKAIISYNKKKQEWGWKAIEVFL
jgi:hypothetical protein